MISSSFKIIKKIIQNIIILENNLNKNKNKDLKINILKIITNHKQSQLLKMKFSF